MTWLTDLLARLFGTYQPPPTFPSAPPPGIPVSTVAETVELAIPAKVDRFEACLAEVLRHEGGFVNHPADPGGATNMGITLRTLQAYRGRPVSVEDVRNLTRDEAAAIYRHNYWAPVQGDALPPGVDLMVFDFGVNSGVARSCRVLQAAVKVTVDGQVGPVTLKAVRAASAAALIEDLAARRMAYLRELPTWPTFGKGWSRRVAETKAKALEMARG